MENYLERIKNFLNEGTFPSTITKVALSVIAIAGISGIVLFAMGMGNAVQVFSMFKKSNKYSQLQIKSAMINLRKQKFIEYVSDKNGTIIVKITTKGNSVLRSFSIDLIKIPIQKQWDGEWRLVMFDLPIKYTKARDSLRFKLKQLGFIQFQKSVWIYPYPCTEEILFIADYYKIGNYIEILEVSNILREMKFEKAFNLNSK